MAQWSTTYNGLLASIQSYVEDNTSEFMSEAQGCINRAEERIIRDLDLSTFNRVLDVGVSLGTQSVSKGFSDGSVLSIFCSGAYGGLELRSRAFIQDAALGANGVPLYYAEDETTLFLAPVSDASYTLSITYLLRPTPLSTSSQTNWLTGNAADALLWAALIESEAFLIAPERVQEFEANYAKSIGPLRALWRSNAQEAYEPMAPTPTPQQTR